jgi:hypothetical protein
MSVKAKRDKTSNPVDVSTWSLELADGEISNAVSEVLERKLGKWLSDVIELISEDSVSVWLARSDENKEWPFTLRVDMKLGAYSDCSETDWTVNLTDLIDDYLDGYKIASENDLGPHYSLTEKNLAHIRSMREHLASWLLEIDLAISSHEIYQEDDG